MTLDRAKITTVQQARALPEVDDAIFEINWRILDAPEAGVGKIGDTVIERTTRKFVAQPIDEDQILLFVDADGRSMRVVYTVDGPAKTPFSL